MSAVVITSLSASGTPASGPSGSPWLRLRSTSAAAARAPSAATCRKACTSSSTAAIRSRCARVTSAAMPVLRQDARDPELAELRRRGLRQNLLGRQARLHDVVAEYVHDRNGMRHRRDLIGRDLLHSGDRADDLVKLAGKVIKFG